MGHVIRRPKEIPARLALEQYFAPNTSAKFKGRPPTNIVSTLDKDLISATCPHLPYNDHNYCVKRELSLKKIFIQQNEPLF